ncbi:hypothetical protein MM221_11105 [Salipaludibacillus sp. LMS25]|uniref:hypothetical protein n=1 Tax=Salipaludibacillus sp. LMS25 TaxID=2924031 RepID=UPI0020D09755|nr:hypothetical protein [Salipaludibacillus sp. LMS25]UTR13201.1 hypothetical protein MM221_11105 [Salipaludibacillus sp. LMS25]
MKNLKLVTAYVSCEFTYNGSKVTARRTGNYMKAHIPLIDTYEKKSAVQKPSSKRRIAYQEGYATFGATYKGNGIKFQARYLRVELECNEKGKIKKTSKLK